ncbi:MAG: repressor LexA [Candidatus Moranbacteria bacterium]|nr:repressor LexA [Candidatus Moranbacteria bacterium]
MKSLTKKQKAVFDIIKDYFAVKGQPPTIREILETCPKYNLKIKSTRSIYQYLLRLQEKGFIERTNRKRGIRLAGKRDNAFLSVPIYGSTNAGLPTIFAEQYIEGYLKISKNIIGNKNVFAVQVSGDSMDLSIVNQKKIEDGDFIIVEPDYKNYQDGDKLLVVIDGLATVKLFKQLDNGNIGLFPESSNSKHKPIYITEADEYVINGRVVDVFKNYQREYQV